MIARALATLAAVATLAACATVQPPSPAPEGSSGWLKLGESAQMGPVITPVAVVEDSRCPTDVQCVWAGRVVVDTRITLRGGTDVRTLRIETGKPVQVADGAVTLVAVYPAKTAGATIAPAEYRFAYHFDGGL